MSLPRPTSGFSLLAAVVFAAGLSAQSTVDTKNWTAAEDHQNMMDQLGIKALRPGPSGNESAPNHANYDEATANPYPNLPDVLTLKNGKKVTTAAVWWNQRRPEIVEDFEREVLGPNPQERSEGDLGGHEDRRSQGRRSSGDRKAASGPRGQFVGPRYTGRHPDDAGGAGGREGAGAGDDDVRRTQHSRGRISRRRYFPGAVDRRDEARAARVADPWVLPRTPIRRRPSN